MSTEKLLESRLIRAVKKRGGYCIKMLPYVETGLPDRQCILPGGVTIYVELKSSASEANNGELKGKQAVWRNRMLQLGHEHWVIFDEKTYNCLLKRMDKLCLL